MEQLATDQQTNKSMKIDQEQIVKITHDMFTSMLNIPEARTGSSVSALPSEVIQGSVSIDGDWHAELRVVASKQLAESIACAMFAMEVDELTTCEIHDAIGEVANVIGGNLKGIVNQDCSLGIPDISTSTSEIPEGALCNQFECFNDTLHVIHIEQ